MQDDRLDGLDSLLEEGAALLGDLGPAARVSSAPGSDGTGSVSVTLDLEGRVAAVAVAPGWRRQLGVDKLADAVVEAARDAAMRRLAAWAESSGGAGGEQVSQGRAGSAGGRSAAGDSPVALVEFDRDDFQRRLQAAATAQLSEEERRAALLELLAMAEAVERGIDEVSGKLQATLGAVHRGQSPDRHVTVTLTGAGEVVDVRCDRSWLREAHEININRQVTGAFRAAYESIATHGVARLIAESPLGEVQRARQDPLGLARRLRLTD